MGIEWRTGPYPVNATFGSVTQKPASPVSRLSTAKDFFSTIQSFILATAALLGFGALCLFLLDSIAEEKLLVDVISAPKEMVDRGYTKEILAQRLMDSIQQINATSGTEKSKYEAASISSSVESVAVPDSAAPVKHFLLLVRKKVGITDFRIAGEFFCPEDTCSREKLNLRLRITGKTPIFIDVGPIGGKSDTQYLDEAAERVIQEVDPYVYASYLEERDRKEEAYKIAHQMYARKHKDAKWGALMVGNYNADRGNRAEAIHYYLQAISLDRHFTQAYHNIGNLHLEFALEKEDPTREQDLQNAERAYRKAIRLERCDASSYDGIAILEMERKKYEVARDAAKQALSCDSNDGAYLATLGQIQLRSGDRDAERIIKDAFAIAPEDPQVNFAMGELYEWLKDYNSAAKHFKVALEGGAFADVYRRSYARALHRAGNHKEAVEIYKGIKKMFLEDSRAIESLEGGATLLGQ